MEHSQQASQPVQWLKNLSPSTVLRFVADSRKLQPGDVFFAYPVGQGDGRKYIQQAIELGAQAIVYEENNFAWNEQWNVPHLPVQNLLWQSGFIVSDYLNQPDASLFTVAVTGTNGKTSCTQWIARALSLAGTPSCVIGTLGVGVAKNGLMSEFDVTGFTTPDAIQLQQTIKMQGESGIGALAIEASSIGLQQGRLNGMHVDVAVFTNFTRDHLDFHGDMAQYEAAKTKLFDWPELKTAVINLDDVLGMRLTQLCRSRGLTVVGYTIDSEDTYIVVDSDPSVSLLRASGVRNFQGGTSFHLDSPFGSGTIKTQLIGRFNVSNVLAVLATLFVKGIAWREAIQSIEKLSSVPGRMEQLNSPGRVLVIIDYAHTPDALEKSLLNLKEVAVERQGKLWCVFGCGGDRDQGKRPLMGEIAEQFADEIIVTSDNPRSEEPEFIMAQIAAGFTPNRFPSPLMEPDRAKAILYAIKHAEKNDVVLLAGKGHEPYQEIKGKKCPFSDVDHAHIALANIASKGVGI
jgi:UDP-N-acetylmuramoyl-L-alanyl-D-glutamate--2,6-diaminopimelate ligase